jgi:hypothetical protein
LSEVLKSKKSKEIETPQEVSELKDKKTSLEKSLETLQNRAFVKEERLAIFMLDQNAALEEKKVRLNSHVLKKVALLNTELSSSDRKS